MDASLIKILIKKSLSNFLSTFIDEHEIRLYWMRVHSYEEYKFILFLLNYFRYKNVCRKYINWWHSLDF